RCRLIHLKIILWNKPLEIGLCNKAVPSYQEAKGKMISVEVKEGLTKSKQIWFRTSGTGQIVLQED
ncbi:hypothetical protein ABTO78_14230, partial [Acinetobacter baumannii]